METNTTIDTAAAALTTGEARFLVNAYYETRDRRKAAASQTAPIADWLGECHRAEEEQIRRTLESWTETIPAARWAKGIVGPVIAAGLAAHIEISRCPTVGRIWRFAGLDPTQVWVKGKKCPWNAALKALCWRIGEAFARWPSDQAHFYAGLYRQRKAQEEAANEAGKFARQAAAKLQLAGANDEERRCYEQGKLPPAHIEARARRWTVKLFLAHYHHVAWTLATGREPARPYVISILGHADFIKPPNFDGGGR